MKVLQRSYIVNEDVLKRLNSAGLLSDEPADEIFVPTGSYALNRVISGSYDKGIPVGRITQFIGRSSTAKTLFLTSILIEAQKLGYYTVLVDSENAFSAEFAKKLGLDPTKLIYSSNSTLEDCFDVIEETIKSIRAIDRETPIIVGYDSIAVSPLKEELDDKYEDSPIIGAKRAKFTGGCFRRLNTILKENDVALVVINQIRTKVGVMFGNPDTQAAGGNALEYYLGVNMETKSNKTSDVIKEDGIPVGITGKVVNKKNKVTLPYQECNFKLIFNKGLDPYEGLMEKLIEDGYLETGKGWFAFKTNPDKHYRKGNFSDHMRDETKEEFNILRDLIQTK